MTIKSEHVEVPGYKGKWHVIAKCYARIGNDPIKALYLMEHETWGDETCGLILDVDGNLVLDDVWNGFDDMYDGFEDVTLYDEDGHEMDSDNDEYYPVDIQFFELKNPIDILIAFNQLQEKAKELNCAMMLNETASFPITFKKSEESNRIVVDMKKSDEQCPCPKCGQILQPSDVPGYECVCENCDENFY